MGTVITRSFKEGSLLSAAGQRRAKEHLLSLGYTEEQLQPIIWPEDAVSAHRDHVGQPWEFTTKADILRRKCERHRNNRKHHRNWMESQITHRRRLYVWVFWCPGISGIFEGWWTYIIGCGVKHGGKYSTDSNLILQAMELFPVTDPRLFDMDWEQRERWMKEFAKRYQRGLWCGKPQGKAPIWAEVKGNSIEKILGRAEWSERPA